MNDFLCIGLHVNRHIYTSITCLNIVLCHSLLLFGFTLGYLLIYYEIRSVYLRYSTFSISSPPINPKYTAIK